MVPAILFLIQILSTLPLPPFSIFALLSKYGVEFIGNHFDKRRIDPDEQQILLAKWFQLNILFNAYLLSAFRLSLD